MDAKDRYTREHSDDVTSLALMLADALRLGAEEQRVLALAGPLHDVGKIAVPDRILRKPGPLSDDEYAAIQRHVTYGVALIRGVLRRRRGRGGRGLPPRALGRPWLPVRPPGPADAIGWAGHAGGRRRLGDVT